MFSLLIALSLVAADPVAEEQRETLRQVKELVLLPDAVRKAHSRETEAVLRQISREPATAEARLAIRFAAATRLHNALTRAARREGVPLEPRGISTRLTTLVLTGKVELPKRLNTPYKEPRSGRLVVRELVRLNHAKNCLLCHSPTAQVQLAYGDLPEGDDALLHTEVTHVKPEFSLLLDAPKGSNPARERFDFVVRVRAATAEEMRRSKEARK